MSGRNYLTSRMILHAFLQPLDGGIIASFKAPYRRLFAQYYVDHFNRYDNLAPKLDALQVIYRTAKAWDSVPSATIFHCWQKVGIVSFMDCKLVRSIWKIFGE